MKATMKNQVPASKVRGILKKAMGDGARAARASVDASLEELGAKPKMAAPPAVPLPKEPGAKRTPEQIEQTAVAALAAIRARPGIIPEQIAAALSTSSADLTRPLRLLVDSHRAKTVGRKRYTRYTAT